MTYSVIAQAYLGRAKKEIASGDPARLFYAAFELRSGIESRLQEYLEHALHVPKKQKQDWSIAKLGLSVDRAFSVNRVARVEMRLLATRALVLRAFYTPISKDLRKLGERLGDYLHAIEYHPPEDEWWGDFRTKLKVCCELLDEAVQGELLGPPLLNRRTGEVWMPMNVPAGVNPLELKRMKGSECYLEFRYFGSLADARDDAA